MMHFTSTFLIDLRCNVFGSTNANAFYVALRAWTLRAAKNPQLDTYIGDDELIVIETESLYGSCLEVGNSFLNEALVLYYGISALLSDVDRYSVCGATVIRLVDDTAVLTINTIGVKMTWPQHPPIPVSR